MDKIEDLEKERERINALMEATPAKGNNKRYLISAIWFEKWRHYVDPGKKSSRPGPINNERLLTKNASWQVRGGIRIKTDFLLLTEEAWIELVKKYEVTNIKNVQITMTIRMQLTETVYDDPKIDTTILMFHLQLYDRVQDLPKKDLRFNQFETIRDIKEQVRAKFGFPKGSFRLWSEQHGTRTALHPSKQRILFSGLADGQTIVVECKKDGSWPFGADGYPSTEKGALLGNAAGKASLSEAVVTYPTHSSQMGTSDSIEDPVPNKTARASSAYQDDSLAAMAKPIATSNRTTPERSDYRKSSFNVVFRNGVCGLQNLGNTCFANSALQCLSNTPLLTKFFASGYGKGESSWFSTAKKSPTANAYAGLVRRMWSGGEDKVSPSDLMALMPHAAELVDGRQHDSFEFLCAVLNGLHDDLNHPHVASSPSLIGCTAVKDKAEQHWSRYRERNNSVIIDAFYGQMRSTVTCLGCDASKTVFDLFSSLTLPLLRSTKKGQKLEPLFVSSDYNVKPKRYTITVPEKGTVEDLYKELSTETGVLPEEMFVTESSKYDLQQYTDSTAKKFRVSDPLDNFMDKNNIVVYELPDRSTRLTRIPVVIRKKYWKTAVVYEELINIFLPVSDCLPSQLYNHVWQRAEQFSMLINDRSSPGDTSMDWSDRSTNQTPSKQGRDFIVRKVDKLGDETDLPDDDIPVNLSDQCYLVVDEKPNCDVSINFTEVKKLEVHHDKNYYTDQRTDKLTLQGCIEDFLGEQILGDDYPWSCDVCEVSHSGSRKLDLWRLPPILVVHLKRFAADGASGGRKIDTFVDFSASSPLDLSKWMVNPGDTKSPLYDLQAVSNHQGYGLASGHYTAFGKNCENWYRFNDTNVEQVHDVRGVVTGDAYMLIYQRQEAAELGRADNEAG